MASTKRLALCRVVHAKLWRLLGPCILAKGLILDEPTSALGVRQTANVLATIDKVCKQGIAVVFITHNVRQAMAVGDPFTVLNRGKTLGTA